MMPGEVVDEPSILPDVNVSEQQSHQVSDFLLELKEKNSLIAFQALLDSIDLWNSCIKYYCDIMNPSSGRASAQMMIDLLHTPGGAALFFVGSALFGAFAFLGNYTNSEDAKNSTIARLSDAYWPYVRDCIKGVKWTYKGMRSVFLVGQVIYTELSIALIVPLGVAFGILSAINRFWNRGMVERRKVLQSANDGFRIHIKCINACYMALDELPSEWELQHIYEGSILNIKGTFFHISVDGNCREVTEFSDVERYILRSNQVVESGGRIDWFHFKTLLTANQIPDTSILYQLCEEKKNFLKELSYQKSVGLNDQAQFDNTDLMCLENLPSESGLRYFYQGCIVKIDSDYYVIDLEADDSKRVLVLSDAEKDFLQTKISGTSINDFQDALNESNLPRESILFQELEKREILSTRCQLYNEIVGRPQFQKDAIQAQCSALLSGVLNAPYYFLGILSMVSLPYTAFIGAVVACSAFMVLNVVAEFYQESEYQRRLKISELKARMSTIRRLMSAELDLINDILNVTDESEYDAKAIYVQRLNEILIAIAPGTALTTLSAFFKVVDDAESLNMLTPEQCALIQHLQNRQSYQEQFRQTKKLLHDELVLNDDYLVMQGIRNGLYCYGIANGFLMTLAIMSFFGIFAFTPVLFWASIGFGFFCLAAGIAYTVLFSNELCELKENKRKNNIQNETSDTENEKHDAELEKGDLMDEVLVEQAQAPSPERDDEQLEGSGQCLISAEDARLATAYYYVDPVSDKCINKTQDDIKATRNLMISDQSEVARQFISGNKKGFKLLQTLSVFLPSLAANSTSGATQLVYLGVGLTYGVFFSLKGLRNLVRIDNKDYKDSTLWKILTYWDKPSSSQNTQTEPVGQPEPSVNSFFSYLRLSSQNLQSMPASPLARAGSPMNQTVDF